MHLLSQNPHIGTGKTPHKRCTGVQDPYGGHSCVRAEGTRTTSFIESLIEELFFPFSAVLPESAQGGQPVGTPCPFIARIHHFRTKQRMMKLVREKGLLAYRGSEIHTYLARKRASFSRQNRTEESRVSSEPGLPGQISSDL